MGRHGELKLHVEVGAVGPDGVGRARGPGGQRVRLPGVLPSERVDAEVVHVRRDGVHFATPERVWAPADARVPSRCPHFLRCGGCDFLHARLEWQAAWKRERVAEALGLPLGDVAPTVASPRPFGYRHLVKLVRGPGPLLGSYAPRSHDVVDMTGCSVHAGTAEQIAEAVRALLRERPATAFRYLLIRLSSSEQRAVVVLVVRSGQRDGTGPVVERLASLPSVAQVRLHVNDAPGDALLASAEDEAVYDDGRPVLERIGPVEHNLAAGAFSQINPEAAARLYAAVTERVEPNADTVLDLYSGSGGIALTLLAAGAARVIAVESHPAAVGAARASAAAAGWSDRLDVIESTVEAALTNVADAPAIVVNPPRKGLGAEVRAALQARPWRRLVYVSCNPDALARDLEALGGRVVSVIPVDLFPQTRHVETVLTLRR